MKYAISCIAFIVFLNAQAQSPVFDVKKLAITWEVVENHHQNKDQFLSALTITNTGKTTFPASGWKLYFNFIRSITATTGGVSAHQVNGDLFYFAPATDFPTIQAGQSHRIEMVASDWVVNFTDAPAGLYLVWDVAHEIGLPIIDYTIKPSTEPKQYLRYPGDKIGLITPELIYQQNARLHPVPLDKLPRVFPTPKNYEETFATFLLDEYVQLIVEDSIFNPERDFFQQTVKSLIGKNVPEVKQADAGKRVIRLRKGSLPSEAYKLSISSTEVIVEAADRAGMFYGIQSFRMAIPPYMWANTQKSVAVPALRVEDEPRFAHRAFMLDVVRNFHSKQQVKKIIDLLALYKLNVFHFHFSEDEGWRVEIPSLPELTQYGAKRGHSSKEEKFLQPAFGSGPAVSSITGSGYYTRADFIEILKYATARHVRIIPEIETPGHARAAIKSMQNRYARLMKEGKQAEAEKYLLHDPQDQSVYRSVQGWNDNVINVAMPSVYSFLETVIDDLQAMYREAGAPLELIHMGGDEVPPGVWEKSPAVKELMKNNPSIQSTDDLWYYYYGKVNALVKKKGLALTGWEEIAMRKTKLDGKPHYIANPDFVSEKFQVDVWNNALGWGAEDLAYQLANAGYKVVLSCVSNLYFDMAYYKDFNEPGYYWGAFVDVDKPFYFIPYDYFKNAKEDKFGNPIDRSIFIGKERLTDYGKSNIVGLQGLIWSETMDSPERLEYMLLPKLLGLAERAWAADPSWATENDPAKAELLYDEAWSSFLSTLGYRELVRLDYYSGGYQYRIPSPGAVIENGAVKANLQFPGFTLRYTIDGKEPSMKSPVYVSPITEKGTIKIRAFNSKGRGGKITVLVNH